MKNHFLHVWGSNPQLSVVRSIANLGCNMYSQITVAHVTLPKAVLNTVKIFAVYKKCTLVTNEKVSYLCAP